MICKSIGKSRRNWFGEIGWLEDVLKKRKINHEFRIIKKAGHCFHEKGTEKILFNKTLNRLKKY